MAHLPLKAGSAGVTSRKAPILGLLAASLLTGTALLTAADASPVRLGDAAIKLAQADTGACNQAGSGQDCVDPRRPGASAKDERRPGGRKEDERRPGAQAREEQRPNAPEPQQQRGEAPAPAKNPQGKPKAEAAAEADVNPKQKPKAEAAAKADVKPAEKPKMAPKDPQAVAAKPVPANDNDSERAPKPKKRDQANDNRPAKQRQARDERQPEQRQVRDERQRPRREAKNGTLEFSLPLPNLNARVVIGSGANARIEHTEDRRFETRDSRRSVEDLRNGNRRITVERPNGVKVVTVRSEDGTILKRYRDLPNGDRVVLIDTRSDEREAARDQRRRERVDLPPLSNELPRDRYIVDSEGAGRQAYRDAFAAAPVEQVERPYSLNEIRDNERLRAKLRRVDLAVNFATGSAAIPRHQFETLAELGDTIAARLEENPSDVFLIEGHTDAVGDATYNLRLSDARAESVAIALTDYFDIPPENLVIQGYGEQYLKVQTESASPRNRRVSVRRITPLLRGDG